ncbi:LysE family translocator [Bordetella genomosp. 9]|uniref:Lysine transporter LysE n=1 Tax=Bordetella genomosp. 9 TaxID=1416803 RepID=A0A1W6Z1R2_9BORD|nr:LysE family translocator [Bordetella genomosp. 9]ARP87039.1 lysine transporter LysE [Bordetella genomosp. 9]ARP91027.1 lysine transporter LysE [Bordetella genomosp. 9]
MSIEFLITSLIVVASPGTGVVITVAAGLTRGTRASIIAAFGCTLGIVPHMLAAMTGLAAVLHASALAFRTVQYLGVAYLLYLAWQSLKDNGALSVDGDAAAPRSALRVIGSAILTNLLNPKLSLFFFAFLPQFLAPGEPAPLHRMLEMSGVFMLMTFLVFALYGACAARVKDRVIGRPAVLAWLRRGFAAAFVALAAKLAIVRP